MMILSVCTRTGAAIAGAILLTAVISGGPGRAIESTAHAPATADEMEKLVYSPWAKVCGKGADGKDVCITTMDARSGAGQSVVAAALLVWRGQPDKLRITIRSPLRLEQGLRVIIDAEPAIASVFSSCVAASCMAEYEAAPALVEKLRTGRTLTVEAVDLSAAVVRFALPLNGASGRSFAAAAGGPPIDLKVVAEQRRRQQQRNFICDSLDPKICFNRY